MRTTFDRNPLSLIHFLVFLILLGNTSCQKELSDDTLGGGGTGGSALFSLIPSGANCSDAVVAGTFQEGVALGADALITVTVNVTKAGDWTYTTTAVNGITVSGAGDFTSTGKQVITLQASGKPAAAGNFDFNLNIGGATCKITVTVSSANTGEFYYKANIDGVNYSQTVTETNGYEPGSDMAGLDDVIFGGGINYANPPLPAGLTGFSIEKGMMHNYLSATQDQFKAFFTPGDYAYAPEDYDNGNGVKVFWTDTNGEAWETRDGPVDQAGSTFKIISTQELIDAAGNYYVKVKVQFSCKLYNTTTGAMKQLTNGEAAVAFGML